MSPKKPSNFDKRPRKPGADRKSDSPRRTESSGKSEYPRKPGQGPRPGGPRRDSASDKPFYPRKPGGGRRFESSPGGGESSDRPFYPRKPREDQGADRPRRPYSEDKSEGYRGPRSGPRDDRPSRPYSGGGGGGYRGAKPGYKDDRPRRSDSEGGSGGYRGSRPDSREDRPRRTESEGRSEGYRSARPGPRDDRPRRPYSEGRSEGFRGPRPGPRDDRPRRDYGDRPDRPRRSDSPPRGERPRREDSAERPALPRRQEEDAAVQSTPATEAVRTREPRAEKTFRKPEEQQPGLFRVYGRRPVLEVLNLGLVRSVELHKNAHGRPIEEIQRLCDEHHVPVKRVESFAEEEGLTVQGVQALAEPPVLREDLRRFLRELPESPLPLILMLDGITDPHNFGAILRSAEGAGVNGVIFRERRQAPITDVVVKSSAGAAYMVPIFQVTNLNQTLHLLKDEGFWSVAAMSGEETRNYTKHNWKSKTVLIVGAEGTGVSELLAKEADDRVSIPMSGKVDSLNVSVATGILLYEAAKTRFAPPEPAAKKTE